MLQQSYTTAFMALPAAVVEARGVTRDFRAPGGTTQALRAINLRVLPGEFVALCGRSGSGKTTLLNILVGLDNPTQGAVSVLGQNLAAMSEGQRAFLRREQIGLLFQNAHLFPALTAQENVELALRLQAIPPTERAKRAQEALERVGLAARTQHRGLELSGGEQQRVALARALVHRPRFIVADEPTGNLDSTTGRNITSLFREIVQSMGIGLLIATHDSTVMDAAARVVRIHDGMIV